MGSSSKILLSGAITLIMGIYAVSLKQVQSNQAVTAAAAINRVQTEKTIDAAMRAALDEYVSGNGNSDKSGTLRAIDGGTFSYSVKKDPVTGGATLTVTMIRVGGTRVATTSLTKVSTTVVPKGSRKIHRGKWLASSTLVSEN